MLQFIIFYVTLSFFRHEVVFCNRVINNNGSNNGNYKTCDK